jgi:hypothetical protein
LSNDEVEASTKPTGTGTINGGQPESQHYCNEPMPRTQNMEMSPDPAKSEQGSALLINHVASIGTAHATTAQRGC